MSERIRKEPKIKGSAEFRRSRKRLTPDLLLHDADFNAVIDDRAIDRAACACKECIREVREIVDIRFPTATETNKEVHVGEYVNIAMKEAPLKLEIRIWEKGSI